MITYICITLPLVVTNHPPLIKLELFTKRKLYNCYLTCISLLTLSDLDYILALVYS